MKYSTRDKLVLAGLLHDIGKFWQRADQSLDSQDNQLSNLSKELAGQICPTNDQYRFGYQHVIWTNEFLEQYIPKEFGFHGNGDKNSSENEDNLFNLAAYHHKPNTFQQAIVTMADWWSSGIDRTKAETLESESEDKNIGIAWGRKKYKQRPLYSIFNSINNKEGNAGFSLKPLILDDSIFPKEITSKSDGVSQEKYAELWKKFVEECKLLPAKDIRSYTESLIYLLKKYTWCIPSSTNDMANVSLYEHLKTTGAFADCLYAYYKENPESFKWESKRLNVVDSQYPVFLLGIDISGIQNFIYSISRSKAAKSLKGRSFYLQLLTDSIIRNIINECDVTQAHVLYSSGGKCYMLMPNTDGVKQALEKINASIEQEMWNQHQGKLSVQMAQIPFRYHTGKNSTLIIEKEEEVDLGELWKKLFEKLNNKKQQKFKTILLSQSGEGSSTTSLFEVAEVGGNVNICSVTGEELEESSTKYFDKDVPVSQAVFDQMEMGTALKDADYLIEYKGSGDSNYLKNRSQGHIRILNTHYYLFDKAQLIIEDAQFRNAISSADVSLVKGLNNPQHFLTAQIKGNGNSYGFQFYGGNEQAYFRNEDGSIRLEKGKKIPKTLEDFCQNSESKNEKDDGSASYLGVLRMDIDGLGKIFVNGLRSEDKSFSAYATMSMLLDTFFSGYLNTIRNQSHYCIPITDKENCECKENDEESKVKKKYYNFRDNVNIIYSGGDDVFAVGRWNEIIGFAEAIRKKFKSFTLHEDMNISAGITIVRSKYPISKAAEYAGDAEKKSKNFKLPTNNTKVPDKNALTFFGQTVGWDLEYEVVKEIKTNFHRIHHITKSKGFLHQLMRLYRLKTENDLSYQWHTAYYFTRFLERYGNKSSDLAELVQDLQKELYTGIKGIAGSRFFELVVLAARWTEMELKFSNK